MILFFGLGILALLILFLVGYFARSRIAIVLGGVVAIGLMTLQFLLIIFVAGAGSAASGSQEGYGLLILPAVLFPICLIAYFSLALAKVERWKQAEKTKRQTSSESGENPVRVSND